MMKINGKTYHLPAKRERFYVNARAPYPDWIQAMIDTGHIESIKPIGGITDCLTYRIGAREAYLYEEDFLEFDPDTNTVTVGYWHWDNLFGHLED
jgi:hypothetical protein